ncbi:MAG: response regulator [Sedimentitalea sp.]
MSTVLVIDDAPEGIEGLTTKVRAAGDFAVLSAVKGSEIQRWFDESRADCVVLGAGNSHEAGLDMVRALKARALFTPVILLSDHTHEDLAKTAILAGASHFLNKQSVDAPLLGESIRAAIRQSQNNRKRAGVHSTPKRIILVDDKPDDREHIADLISDANPGVTIEALATGAQALASFQDFGTDCILLDYRLETEDGLDVLVALKDLSPFVPVIMLTGQGSEEIAAKAIKLGAADYLVKTRLTGTNLRTAITNAISRSWLEARVADQDAERRQFLNILVHDLRQPLRNVKLIGEMIEQALDDGDTSKLRTLLSHQATAATGADELIGTLQGYALLDRPVEFAPVSLTEVANAACEILGAEIIKRQAKVVVRDMPIVQGNDAQLTQLFQNLIGNGLKYHGDNPPHIIIERESQDEDGVIIVVRDNGIGIAQKHLKSVFAPLKRLWTQDEYAGTGLGLATCHKISVGHGGLIWCTSSEGLGSAFHIRFPSIP